MPTGNTSLLGLALPVEGELSGTWGDVVNDSITSLVDSAVAGTTTLSADSDVTLTDTALATNQARQAIIRWTASNGATIRNITAPARSKPYIVINAGTGSIVLRGAGSPTPTTGITIVAGERCVVAWSGSDFVKVGGTSGSGTFTDLTVTGNTTLGDAAGDTVTINGATTFANVSPTITPGTANGVAYLNGSKVLTTGGALTFDGTNFATTGQGTFRSLVLNGVGTSQLGTSDASGLYIDANTTGGMYLQSGNSFIFRASAAGSYAEYMRLTSTGLGIGTSSPSAKLHVNGSFGTTATGAIRLTGTGQTTGDLAPISFYLQSSGWGTVHQATITAQQVSGSNGGANLLFGTSADGSASPTTRMTLDSSGNLGLGVTPSAWDTSVFRTVQIGSGAGSVSLSGRSDSTKDMVLGSNVYYGTGNFRYVGTSVATMYRQDGATHAWFTAPSGTAGNAISFTQAMTLGAAGDLGVGTTSPSARLDVQQDTDTIIQRLMNTRTTGNSVCSSRIYGNNGATQFQIDVDGLGSVFGAGASLGMNSNHFLAFKTNNTERARITSGGFFGLGVTSPQAMFDLAGDYKEGVVTANTGTAYTINTATGTLQILTLTGNCTFTFPTAVAGESFTLFLRQDGTGSRTVTWPANVRWPGGTAPTITSTASRQDKYIFTADGTNWYGSNAGQNYTV